MEIVESKIGFDTLRALTSERCLSAMGREETMAMSWATDYGEVCGRLGAVAEFMALLGADDELTLGGLHDIRPALSALRIEGSLLPPAELVKVRRTLQCGVDSIKNLELEGRETLRGRARVPEGALATCVAAGREIDRVIDPASATVLDNASPTLAGIRSQLARMNGVIARTMRRVMGRAMEEGVIDADTTAAVRDGRLVIPVSPANKRRITGIVHDESASGKTVYVEPAEVVEANNRLRELEMEEQREVARILSALADVLRPHLGLFRAVCDMLGRLDFIRAKAIMAKEMDARLPQVSDHPELELYGARHPLLQRSLERQGRSIVAIDIRLTPADRVLLISGPNAGGKSVALKTVGILQYMMQAGMLPPVYENSRMGVFSRLLVDIGDDQSIEDDLSTYSSHLKNMRRFLLTGDDRTLFLADEPGSGTEPRIGAAIAQSLLQRFVEMGMWGVVTTHFHSLKRFAAETAGVVNGAMAYDRQRMMPLYSLTIGHPGSSFAVEIARKIGLPADILDNAAALVGDGYINLDRYLLDIARDKRYWENKRTEIKKKERRLDDTIERYEADADDLRARRREIIADARTEAQRILESSNAAVERTIRDIREAQADSARTAEARRRLHDQRTALGQESPAEEAAGNHPLLRKAPKKAAPKVKPPEKKAAPKLEVGANVLLDGSGTPGRIMSIEGNQAIVAFGVLKTTVKLSRLTPTLRKPQSGAKEPGVVTTATTEASRERQLHFTQEIDVRGMRVDEALQAVTYYIDDAIQFNAGRVRILHGTGTGALRQYLRQYLATVAGVASYHDEDVRFGGAGITVVELK